MRWLRALAILLCLVVAALAVAGATYQALAGSADARRHPEPGTLVDIGGRKFLLNCTGVGGPTVILESGLGDASSEWQAVQLDTAKFARVCSYDRAGYGASDAGPLPRTSARIADDLHTLLERAEEKPPFVLVGHSFGGYSVRVFNGKFPDEVAGLVLVDTPQEDQYGLLPGWQRLSDRLLRRYQSQARWAPLLIDLGIARLMLRLQGYEENSYLFLQSKVLRTRANELENMRTSAEEARAADHIADRPLLVLTGGDTSEVALAANLNNNESKRYREIWVNDLQVRLTRLSARGKQVVVECGHDVPNLRPDAIVGGIRRVRDEARGVR